MKVIAGKEKGKTGKVLKVINDKDKVVVEKLNIVKRHKKPDQKGKGGIVEKEGPINISNVMFLCNKCDEGVRAGEANCTIAGRMALNIGNPWSSHRCVSPMEKSAIMSR